MKTYRIFKLGLSVVFLLIFLTNTAFTQESKISTIDEIKEDIKANVCKNDERLEAVKKLFVKMGAPDEAIKIEKIKNAENLIVTHKGKSEETIIVGAHFDKVADGCGALDNWTGIVILANLYRTLRAFDTNKNFVFVAFGKEELGLIGSEEMARAIPKEKRINYCAMVNFDSFGLSFPQAMTNISDTKLIDLAEKTSDELKLRFAKAAIQNASSDSQSFRNQKIPAITIHGMSDKWQEFLHSSKDKVENVNAQSVYFGYRFGLNYLAKIEAKECGEFRK